MMENKAGLDRKVKLKKKIFGIFVINFYWVGGYRVYLSEIIKKEVFGGWLEFIFRKIFGCNFRNFGVAGVFKSFVKNGEKNKVIEFRL